MSDNELKPCPLCGGDVRITYLIGMGMDTGNWIECPACNRSYIWADHIGRALWNTRPIEDALRARIAELEAAIDDALGIIAGGNPDLPGEVLAEVEARLQEVCRGNDSCPLPHD